MLSLASWWPHAEDLEIGQKRRRPHDCGEGRTLIVNRDVGGFHAWCHRCNDKGWKPPPQETLAQKLERIARLREGDLALSGTTSALLLPVPRVLEVDQWPDAGKLWLYKAGLGRAEIGRLGIYYHEPSDRIVLPVYDGNGECFFQARAYQKDRFPKYLGPTPRPPRLMARWGSFVVPTLTEDMLSARKIGLVAEGWAVLGTRVSDHMVSELMKRGGRVNVWLDPDPAGRKGAEKIGKQLRAYGLEVRDILSERDPKLHTRDQILEYVS
jgi:hypothetical protein